MSASLGPGWAPLGMLVGVSVACLRAVGKSASSRPRSNSLTVSLLGTNGKETFECPSRRLRTMIEKVILSPLTPAVETTIWVVDECCKTLEDLKLLW